METNEKEFLKIIECCKQAGILGDIIVIGSWAEYMYDKGRVITDFHPLIKTTDVDLLIPNLRKPAEPSNFVQIAKQAGFQYDEDYMSGYSRLIGEENFEVDFLIEQKGNGTKKLPRTNIGVNAQQLTHLWMLNHFAIFVKIEHGIVRVPEPEAYVLHKIIINHSRADKAATDRQKIDALLSKLDYDKLEVIYDSLFKSEKRQVNEYIQKYYHKQGLTECIAQYKIEKTPELISNRLKTLLKEASIYCLKYKKQNSNEELKQKSIHILQEIMHATQDEDVILDYINKNYPELIDIYQIGIAETELEK